MEQEKEQNMKQELEKNMEQEQEKNMKQEQELDQILIEILIIVQFMVKKNLDNLREVKWQFQKLEGEHKGIDMNIYMSK